MSKSAEPVIGVVIPAYNSAKYLKKLIKSIISATKRPFECVVVNDGSSDNISDVFFETVAGDSRFTLLSIPNGGVAAARNAGYRLLSANVTHVTFMDADDAYVDGGLDKLLDRLLMRADVRVVHGTGTFEYDSTGVDTSGEYEQYCLSRVTHKNGFPQNLPVDADSTLASVISKSTMFPPGLVLIERSIIEEVGLFESSEFLRHADDWHFMIRLAIAGQIAFLPESVLLYGRHDANAGAAPSIPVACSNLWKMIYWNPENSLELVRQLRFAWRAKQINDLRQRIVMFNRQRSMLSLVKVLIGIITCSIRWIRGAPTKKLKEIRR